MRVFRSERGLVAPLLRDHVDTDQIIPKQFLKRIERSGFGEFLFHDWRLDPSFVLNDSRFRSASILLAGRNFGCGSSREHAPWALMDYGFRAIIASSFADIFATNCAKNGLLTVALDEATVEEIGRRSWSLDSYRLTVDLESCRVFDSVGLDVSFSLDPFRRRCLLDGLDEIGLTLRHEEAIARYETRSAGGPAAGRRPARPPVAPVGASGH